MASEGNVASNSQEIFGESVDEETPFIGIGATVEETEPKVKTASGRIKSSPSNAPNVKKIDVSIICKPFKCAFCWFWDAFGIRIAAIDSLEPYYLYSYLAQPPSGIEIPDSGFFRVHKTSSFICRSVLQRQEVLLQIFVDQIAPPHVV